MREFVRDHVDQGLVPGDQGRRQERQARILHAAERERRRQHQHVVAAPAIGAVELLGGDDHRLDVLEFLRHRIEPTRLGPDIRTRPDLLGHDVAGGDREQVGRNRLRHVEAEAGPAVAAGLVVGAHHDADAVRRGDAGAIREAHRGRVLQRREAARMDGLRLREHEGLLLAQRLRRFQPLQAGGFGRGVVVDAHLRRGVLQSDRELRAELRVALRERERGVRPGAVGTLRADAFDRQIAGVEIQPLGLGLFPVEAEFGESAQLLLLERDVEVEVDVRDPHLVEPRIGMFVARDFRPRHRDRSHRHQHGHQAAKQVPHDPSPAKRRRV